MTLWIIFAAMTAAAIFAVLWPLERKSATARSGSDVLVYKDQLEEIDRDRSAGMIGEAEAEAARVEVSRRLLAAADVQAASQAAAKAPAADSPRPLRRRRTAAVAALGILVLLPLGLYLMLGSPNVPGQPAFARVKSPQGNPSIESLIAQVETHLAQNPNDGTGWELIAPVYMRLGRYDDAVQARRKALALNGETALRQSDLGEALVAAANGVVTAEAKQTFTAAVAHDPQEPKARYFLGLADEQDGDSAAAAATWRAMLNDAPAGAPWAGFVREALGRVSNEPAAAAAPALAPGAATATAAPGPSADDMAAASNMSEAQRGEMIRAMVAKLADRLHADGSDVEGWLRLVRAYVVLGDRDKAKSAADDARRALASRPEELKRIDDLAKGLGLEG
jgi:cytochrome c-type biogenesis protein CcmH